LKINDVYGAICTLWERNLASPSIGEILAELGVGSKTTLHQRLGELEEAGVLRPRRGRRRFYVPTTLRVVIGPRKDSDEVVSTRNGNGI
jgi:SOS-response transcriptional repressor LexA